MTKFDENAPFDYLNDITDSQEFFQQMNKSFGNALQELSIPPHKVRGRDKELKQLDIQMNRPITSNAMLLGLAGVGKTALVETWIKIQAERGKKVVLFSLSLGAMNNRGKTILQQRMEALIPTLKQYENLLKKEDPRTEVVLFIDEVHMIISIFGKGSKIGGDLLKTSLARESIKVIVATTRGEYDSYIANDAALARRFKNVQINELPKNITKEILYNWLAVYAPDYKNVADETLEKCIRANRLYRPEFAEPAKSIDILESAVGTCIVEGGYITNEVIDNIFQDQYNVNLNFSANYKHVKNTILKRVKGQPMALYTADRVTKRLVFSSNDSNKPREAMLLVGPSGVGKTELTKALAEGTYGSEDKIVFCKMNQYANENAAESWVKELGKNVRHQQDTIILLDEIEKAHENVFKVLLSVMEEGLLHFTEVGTDGYEVPHEVSLRNTIIIATSNAAADLFKDVHRFSKQKKTITQDNMNEYTQSLKQEYEELESDIRESLLNTDKRKFTPEFLGRFSQIIPFYALHESTQLYIAEKSIIKVLKYFNNLPENYSVKISQKRDWSHMDYNYTATSIAMYIVFELGSIHDSNSGGARAIENYIQNNLYNEIIETILDNPDERRFFIKTNGKCGFETNAYGTGQGGIIVEPENARTSNSPLVTQ